MLKFQMKVETYLLSGDIPCVMAKNLEGKKDLEVRAGWEVSSPRPLMELT